MLPANDTEVDMLKSLKPCNGTSSEIRDFVSKKMKKMRLAHWPRATGLS